MRGAEKDDRAGGRHLQPELCGWYATRRPLRLADRKQDSSDSSSHGSPLFTDARTCNSPHGRRTVVTDDSYHQGIFTSRQRTRIYHFSEDDRFHDRCGKKAGAYLHLTSKDALLIFGECVSSRQLFGAWGQVRVLRNVFSRFWRSKISSRSLSQP